MRSSVARIFSAFLGGMESVAFGFACTDINVDIHTDIDVDIHVFFQFSFFPFFQSGFVSVFLSGSFGLFCPVSGGRVWR